MFWGGSPTIASTQTILFNAALSGAHYLEQNTYVPFDPEAGHYQLAIPGQHELALALPWGGTSHPVWYRKDPRVANCKALGGVFNKALMLGVPQIVAGALEATKDMEPDEKYAALAATAAQVMNTMPPRENPRLNKSLDSVHASGPLGRAHCVIHGNQNYKQTGLLQAYAAYSLLQQPPKRVGFASGCQAFGHRELLGVLRVLRAGVGAGADRRGLSRVVRLVDYLDKGASVGSRRALPDHRRHQLVVRRGARAQLPHRGGAGARRGDARATRSRSCRPTTRSRSPASSGSAGPAPCGARSTRATRRRRTASCSTSSTARC